MRALASVVFLTLLLALPAQAQTTQSLDPDQVLLEQLRVNGVADPANATGEEIAAAIAALSANNAELSGLAFTDLVMAGVRLNPSAYETIAQSAAETAADAGQPDYVLIDILAAAIGLARAHGEDTTGAAARLSSAVSTATGRSISSPDVATLAVDYTNFENRVLSGESPDSYYNQVLALIIEENPNQDASPT